MTQSEFNEAEMQAFEKGLTDELAAATARGEAATAGQGPDAKAEAVARELRAQSAWSRNSTSSSAPTGTLRGERLLTRPG